MPTPPFSDLTAFLTELNDRMTDIDDIVAWELAAAQQAIARLATEQSSSS